MISVGNCPTTYASNPCIPSTYRPSTTVTFDEESDPAKTGSQNRDAAIAASVVVVVGVVGGGLGVGLFLYYRRRRSNNGHGGKGEESRMGGNVAMVEMNGNYVALGNNTNSNYNRDSAVQGKPIDKLWKLYDRIRMDSS